MIVKWVWPCRFDWQLAPHQKWLDFMWLWSCHWIEKSLISLTFIASIWQSACYLFFFYVVVLVCFFRWIKLWRSYLRHDVYLLSEHLCVKRLLFFVKMLNQLTVHLGFVKKHLLLMLHRFCSKLKHIYCCVFYDSYCWLTKLYLSW